MAGSSQDVMEALQNTREISPARLVTMFTQLLRQVHSEGGGESADGDASEDEDEEEAKILLEQLLGEDWDKRGRLTGRDVVRIARSQLVQSIPDTISVSSDDSGAAEEEEPPARPPAKRRRQAADAASPPEAACACLRHDDWAPPGTARTQRVYQCGHCDTCCWLSRLAGTGRHRCDLRRHRPTEAKVRWAFPDGHVRQVLLERARDYGKWQEKLRAHDVTCKACSRR
eukprot:TRINITY_DN35461_c0_g1_i1.p2 TRINITY_DN35461_c0_g1~~TRINITY_DN35461_c0_g1_i1.p2  ORF type:complete len:248 (+),score=72.29 TRINITY_DN35461_c0_g1_i1:62-745(+)